MKPVAGAGGIANSRAAIFRASLCSSGVLVIDPSRGWLCGLVIHGEALVGLGARKGSRCAGGHRCRYWWEPFLARLKLTPHREASDVGRV